MPVLATFGCIRRIFRVHMSYCSLRAKNRLKRKLSGQVPVDYVRVKYVKKPNGAKPGYVIFTNNNTVYVTPADPAAAQPESEKSK